MARSDKESTMGVKLDTTTRERLKALGQVRERSAHYLAVTAIKRYLDEEEAFEARKRAEIAAWEEYRQTGEHVSQEQMDAWLSQVAQGKHVAWDEI